MRRGEKWEEIGESKSKKNQVLAYYPVSVITTNV